jgi:hypothetical protein
VSRSLRSERAPAEVRSYLPLAVGGYLAARAVGVLVIGWWADRRDIGVFHLLATRSDATWYLGIARRGYDEGQGQSDVAFFPLYPGLVSGVGQVLGRDAYPGLVVAWTASLVAAAGLFALGTAVTGPRIGVMLTILWRAQPHSVVQVMGYAESLFVALAAWCLWALLRRHWLSAGLLCAAAGLARPSAAALVPVVVADAVLSFWRGPRNWRQVVAALLAPLGMVGYLGWVAGRTGRLDGWSHVQQDGWGSSWDWGVDAVRQAGRVLTAEQSLDLYVVTLVVLVSILLAALSLLDRQAWQVTCYGLAALALTIGSGGYYHAKARLLLVAFPLLLPAARALAVAPAVHRVLVLVALMAGSAWFGGHLLLVWPWSP